MRPERYIFRPVIEDRRRSWLPGQDSALAVVKQVWRLVVIAAGSAVTLAGVAMLVLPGPGLLAIAAGLAILATEFAWARGLLDRARARLHRLREEHRRRSR
jgi:uncharacterized protein (TIGR02611 family)